MDKPGRQERAVPIAVNAQVVGGRSVEGGDGHGHPPRNGQVFAGIGLAACVDLHGFAIGGLAGWTGLLGALAATPILVPQFFFRLGRTRTIWRAWRAAAADATVGLTIGRWGTLGIIAIGSPIMIVVDSVVAIF